MKNCLFCEFTSGRKPVKNKIWEDDRILVFLDIDWAVKGHTNVMWKKHATNLSDLSEEEVKYFSAIVQRTEEALLDVLHLDKSFIMKSGFLIDHLHFHIYPVSTKTPWENVLAAVQKESKYKPRPGEAKAFIKKLHQKIAS